MQIYCIHIFYNYILNWTIVFQQSNLYTCRPHPHICCCTSLLWLFWTQFPQLIPMFWIVQRKMCMVFPCKISWILQRPFFLSNRVSTVCGGPEVWNFHEPAEFMLKDVKSNYLICYIVTTSPWNHRAQPILNSLRTFWDIPRTLVVPALCAVYLWALQRVVVNGKFIRYSERHLGRFCPKTVISNTWFLRGIFHITLW